MTGNQALVARTGLGVLAAAAGFILVSVRRFQDGSQRAFGRRTMALLVLSRLGLFGLAFFVLHIAPRGDVPAFYAPQAAAVLQGQIPYRDFASSYAPLHAYLDAGIFALWRSSLAIILLAIVAELFLLPIWMKVARLFLNERRVRVAALCYVASPISLQFVAIDGQDNVLIALLFALAALCLYKRRAFVSGVLLAGGVATVKFLPLMYAPIFWMASCRRWRWVGGFVSTIALVYGLFVFRGADVLYPFAAEAGERTASDFPFLLESVCGVALSPRLEDGVLMTALLVLLIWIVRSLYQPCGNAVSDLPNRLRIVTFGSTALTLTLLLLSKKSWPPYLMLVLFPICLLLDRGARRKLRFLAFFLFGIVAIVAHSFWATEFRQCLPPAFHQALVAHQPTALLFLALQVLLIAGYCWLLFEAITETGIATRLATSASE